MMPKIEVECIKNFIDKETNIPHRVGKKFEVIEGRAKELVNAGVVKVLKTEKSKKEEGAK